MSEFDKIIKDKLNSFDVPFNEEHWDAMNKRLDAIKRIKIIKNSVITIVSVAAVLVGIYFTTQQHDSKINIESNQMVTNTPTYNNTTTGNLEVKNEKSQPIHVENLNHTTEKITSSEQIENKEIKVEQNNKIADVKPTEIQKNSPISQEIITADFDVQNNKTCLGIETIFEAKEKKELIAYLWDFGDGLTSTKQNPSHLYKNAGIYSISLTVTNKKTNEEVKTTQRNLVQIYPLPTTDFSYLELSSQFDDNKLKYPTTTFNYKGISTDVCDWVFGNGITSKSKNPTVLFDKKGDYTVTLNTRNEFGCTNTILKTIQINSSFELFAPNAFTPNFDGNNDEFMPEALQTWDIKFELIIKNKSGNIIYSTKDKNEGWKGSLNNQGSVLDEGLYFWQVVTYDVDGKPYQHIGKINLIK